MYYSVHVHKHKIFLITVTCELTDTVDVHYFLNKGKIFMEIATLSCSYFRLLIL